jgi:hypothetical protein
MIATVMTAHRFPQESAVKGRKRGGYAMGGLRREKDGAS